MSGAVRVRPPLGELTMTPPAGLLEAIAPRLRNQIDRLARQAGARVRVVVVAASGDSEEALAALADGSGLRARALAPRVLQIELPVEAFDEVLVPAKAHWAYADVASRYAGRRVLGPEVAADVAIEVEAGHGPALVRLGAKATGARGGLVLARVAGGRLAEVLAAPFVRSVEVLAVDPDPVEPERVDEELDPSVPPPDAED